MTDKPEANDTDDAKDRQIADLSREAAGYRTQRNDALRRAHAFETMLKVHNIDLSPVTTERLSALTVKAGTVDGAFEYAAPKVAVPKNDAATDAAPRGDTALTREAIAGMGPAEINKRWDEVREVLRST